MDLANYKMEWPRERLTVRCFAHDIMNYRYHWHPDEYELNILLHAVKSTAVERRMLYWRRMTFCSLRRE
jgi:hypothetical protein